MASFLDRCVLFFFLAQSLEKSVVSTEQSVRTALLSFSLFVCVHALASHCVRPHTLLIGLALQLIGLWYNIDCGYIPCIKHIHTCMQAHIIILRGPGPCTEVKVPRW